MIAESSLLKGRRRGNLVVVGSDSSLPLVALSRAAASDPFPARVVTGDELQRFVSGSPVVTDAAVTANTTASAETSPQPTNW
jgi:hypothetical protein